MVQSFNMSAKSLTYKYVGFWASTGSTIMSTLHFAPSKCLQVGAFSQPSELQEVCPTLISSLYSLLIHCTGT